mgnify:CR=1
MQDKINVAKKMVDCQTSSSTTENNCNNLTMEEDITISTRSEFAIKKKTETEEITKPYF